MSSSLPASSSSNSPLSTGTNSKGLGMLAHASIMMIDDEPILVEVVRTFLAESGFTEFVSITDPTLAIAAIQTQRPDMLLLDLKMPKVSGFDILKMVRQDPYLKMLPVVVMTSASDAETKLRVLELGATDFLEKPVDPSELALRVRNTLAVKAYNDRMAYFDPLTSLPNRSFLMHQLAGQVRRSARTLTPFSVLQVNLDRFNKINESLGHRSADALLVSVAERLQACIRGTDGIGRPADQPGGNSLSRFSGDEFTAVLVDLPEGLLAGQVAKRLQDAIARPFHIDGNELFINASIGIATFPNDGDTAESLLRNAESAMRESKRIGPKTIRYFNSAYNRESADRLALESQLHRAIERGEFRLLYQPKVDLRTLEIVGAEALIRWQHPERGLLTPNFFISIAEQSRLIIDMGAWVIDEACRQMAEWKHLGIRDLKIAVNVATPQLAENRLSKDLKRSIGRHGVKPSNLIVEFTESILMQSDQEIDIAVKAVAETGVSISLDDFGTGFSSLAYLKRLPLTELKIDRSFVMGLPGDKDSAAIVGAVVALARNLGLQVTAEGVETEGQLHFLQSLGCNQFQGFLRSKPIAPQDFIALLK
jgi:diguanylate cyclase